MEHRVGEIASAQAHAVHQLGGSIGDMMEVSWFACKASGMLWVRLMLAAPEIWRVRYIRDRAFKHRDGFFSGAYQVSRTTGTRSVFQCIARPALRAVHPDGKSITGHAAADIADRRLHRLGPGLASKLPVGGLGIGRCANGFGHNRAGRFYRIGVRLAADPNCANLLRAKLITGPPECVASRLHTHRNDIFIQTGNGFFAHWRNRVAIGP